jgi:hypothetical protein
MVRPLHRAVDSEAGFPGWIGSTTPKAAEMLAEPQIPSFTRRVRQDLAAWFTARS